MTAIAELRKKAAEKFDSYTVEFENDTLRLKNVLELDGQEVAKFSAAQKALTEMDEEEPEGEDINAQIDGIRTQFVDCLVMLAEDKRKARKLLSNESIALLMVILEEYGASAADASKSDGSE